MAEPSSLPIRSSDWPRLYAFCRRQALVGVGFRVVELLHGRGVVCPAALRAEWMAEALRIERANRALVMRSAAVQRRFEGAGFRCCVLKGQGNLLNYPPPLRWRRTPGDIDIWVRGEGRDGRRRVVDHVLSLFPAGSGRPARRLRWHHVDAPDEEGTGVEAHFRLEHVNSPLRNRRLARWADSVADACCGNRSELGFSVPTLPVNVVYQTAHLFKHFFGEGVGLRQLLDLYFLLIRWHRECPESASQVMRTLRRLGLYRFAAAVMWTLREVFSLPDECLVCEPSERGGRQLLSEILAGGNFGHYDRRGAGLRRGGTLAHGVWRMGRVLRLASRYPEEAVSEPLFRVYHLLWRKYMAHALRGRERTP